MKLKSLFRPKIIAGIVLFGIIAGGIWYAQLSNRHKAIVKTTLLHGLRIIDHDWEISHSDSTIALESPDLLVDNIYQSMDGPQAILNLELNPEDDNLKWITGFKTEVFREGTYEHNNDFLCHTNIDFSSGIHYQNLKLPKRINVRYPRLGTLSNGINEVNFPEGFGFPITGKDAFIIASRTLNHNIEDAFFKVKHNIEFRIEPAEKQLKPLVPKALVLLQDFNRDNPDHPERSDDPNLCLPLDLKNHSFPDAEGVRLAGHWVLPKGEHLYKFDVTYQLHFEEDTTIHAMTAHLHPDAQRFTLYDLTADKEVYTIECENYEEKIGLKNVSSYSSVEGIPIYVDHQYELQLLTNNPSDEFRDMMAVLFMYVYDREMDEHLQSTNYLN
ncbi:hypothetical protein J1N09_14180 [Aureitalea sp. L0-47]|uniref:hypothetical protein n=1 Tax=Aureitalea sp. L0-47 TaxID=2816962 RepID=UPI0022382EC1|nr:hypothetical protein [Aureitalea sp. L0-47]MCW5520993.1 hypothetical protein [Aureitalea sp. L0-47]